jgi:hypothetical protein
MTNFLFCYKFYNTCNKRIRKAYKTLSKVTDDTSTLSHQMVEKHLTCVLENRR